MGSHSSNARERIIDAAEQVVVHAGARNLTLEAVASKAGISRGGLLYHFPDKEALLKGMLERRRKHITENRNRKRAEIPASPEREAIVYVLSMLGRDTHINQSVSSALIASAAHNPDLLAVARKDFQLVIDELTGEGLSFERAAVIMLATNGLKLMEVLSMSPFDAGKRRKIIKELLALTKENKRGLDR